MLLCWFDFDQNIIHINFHISTNLISENFVHEPLISGSNIFKSKRHEEIAECFARDDEVDLIFVLLDQENLIITLLNLQESQEFVPDSRINQLIDLR